METAHTKAKVWCVQGTMNTQGGERVGEEKGWQRRWRLVALGCRGPC